MVSCYNFKLLYVAHKFKQTHTHGQTPDKVTPMWRYALQGTRKIAKQ